MDGPPPPGSQVLPTDHSTGSRSGDVGPYRDPTRVSGVRDGRHRVLSRLRSPTTPRGCDPQSRRGPPLHTRGVVQVKSHGVLRLPLPGFPAPRRGGATVPSVVSSTTSPAGTGVSDRSGNEGRTDLGRTSLPRVIGRHPLSRSVPTSPSPTHLSPLVFHSGSWNYLAVPNYNPIPPVSDRVVPTPDSARTLGSSLVRDGASVGRGVSGTSTFRVQTEWTHRRVQGVWDRGSAPPDVSWTSLLFPLFSARPTTLPSRCQGRHRPLRHRGPRGVTFSTGRPPWYPLSVLNKP